MRREIGEVVKDFFGHGVEHVVLPEDFEAFGFVFWNRCAHDFGCGDNKEEKG